MEYDQDTLSTLGQIYELEACEKNKALHNSCDNDITDQYFYHLKNLIMAKWKIVAYLTWEMLHNNIKQNVYVRYS
jgi:hypothetical protein